MYLSSVCATHPPEHPFIPAMGYDIPANSRRPNPLTIGKCSGRAAQRALIQQDKLNNRRKELDRGGQNVFLPTYFPPQNNNLTVQIMLQIHPRRHLRKCKQLSFRSDPIGCFQSFGNNHDFPARKAIKTPNVMDL